jgi:hypothetical protein
MIPAGFQLADAVGSAFEKLARQKNEFPDDEVRFR